MKRIYKLMLVILILAGVSCKKDFLDEKALDFLSTTNAFKNAKDFDASINNLYNLVRTEFYTRSDWQPMQYLYRTDLVVEVAVGGNPNLVTDFGPSGTLSNNHWNQLFKIVAEANTVLSRIPASELTDDEKVIFEAKAKFFRGFIYRTIAYLWGGVPLVTEEIVAEKTDFTRATKAEVLAQVVSDLEFAAANLPAINDVKLDGEISKAAAQHLLAEVYLAVGDNNKALAAATAVIDDPNTDLMKTRFGSRSTFNPGDVYFDLFQAKNQNRKAGNKEAIWVIQFETDVLGGSATSTGMAGTYLLERVHVPLFRDIRVGGVALFQWPIGDWTGGRGVGFMQPTRYFENDVWQSDWANDIRNANHNFVREFVCTNPGSPFFGQTVSTNNPPAGAGVTFPSRVFYPYQSKATTVFNHPSGLYVNPSSADPIKKWEVKSTAGGTYTDQYMFRLAETYLLRAEAYLNLNNKAAAAADINQVRSRANASAVLEANVTLDYILDERMRELGVEEKRMLTLMRLGKLVDRVKAHSPFYAANIQPHHNLWAIPQGEIERNRTAVLEQNPGYQ
jgi:starch-binding outer membrane protein, SusD/RagB family